MTDHQSFISTGGFMAIIVNKIQKRKDIALACKDILLEKGIKNLTISEVAMTANIGKGTVYGYFKNKEDIVFEVIRNYIDEYHQDFNAKFNSHSTTKEKVFLLFDFFLSDDNLLKKHQEIYREYLSITLGDKENSMSKFNNECGSFSQIILRQIIEEGVRKGEIIEKSIKMIDGLIAAEKGFMLISWMENKNIKLEFIEFINTLFQLLETEK